MATIDVEIDIDEFDTDEIVSETINRIGSKWNKVSDEQLKELREALNIPNAHFRTPSLRESLKYEHLVEIFEQYSLEEIQELLPNKMMQKAI